MSLVVVEKNRYTVDPFYQWDKNQVLEIRGLSLASVPEIHFTNNTMDRAIVRRATMNTAGVITVKVPNSLLQKPYSITAYVCTYEGDTFQSLYTIAIPVKARNKPADYTLEITDEEVYSFSNLENQIVNFGYTVEKNTEVANTAMATANEASEVANGIAGTANEALSVANESKQIVESASTEISTAIEYLNAEKLGKEETAADSAKINGVALKIDWDEATQTLALTW